MFSSPILPPSPPPPSSALLHHRRPSSSSQLWGCRRSAPCSGAHFPLAHQTGSTASRPVCILRRPSSRSMRGPICLAPTFAIGPGRCQATRWLLETGAPRDLSCFARPMSSMTDARDGCPKRSILRAQPKWKQPSIGSSVFLQRNFKDGPVADDNPWHPGRQFAMVCKTLARLRLRLLPPLEPSLGATDLRSKSPDFLLLGRGPRKGETAIAKLLVSTAMMQDKTEKTDKRTWPGATAHHPPPPATTRPLPVRSAASAWRGGNEMRRTVLVPSFGKMSCSCPPSSALAAANQVSLRPRPLV